MTNITNKEFCPLLFRFSYSVRYCGSSSFEPLQYVQSQFSFDGESDAWLWFRSYVLSLKSNDDVADLQLYSFGLEFFYKKYSHLELSNIDVVSNEIVLTKPLILVGSANYCGYNELQLSYLGIHYPLIQGWQNALIGKRVSIFDYLNFVVLKDKTKKKQKALKNFEDQLSLFHML